MHHHLLVRHFKIKSPVLRPETIEGLPVPLDLAKAFIVQMFQIILRHLELIEQLKLFQCVELGNLSRTDFVKDDL